MLISAPTWWRGEKKSLYYSAFDGFVLSSDFALSARFTGAINSFLIIFSVPDLSWMPLCLISLYLLINHLKITWLWTAITHNHYAGFLHQSGSYSLPRWLFIFTVAWTPLLTNFLYKYRPGKKIENSQEKTPVFTKMHSHKADTPTMGGLLVWITALDRDAMYFLSPWKFTSFELLIELISPVKKRNIIAADALVLATALSVVWWLARCPRGTDGREGWRSKAQAPDLLWLSPLCGPCLSFILSLAGMFFHILYQQFHVGWWYILIFVFVIVATAFSVQWNGRRLDGLAGGTLLFPRRVYRLSLSLWENTT